MCYWSVLEKVLDACTKTTRILKIWDIYIACALLIQFWNHVLGTCMNRSFEIQKEKAKATGVKKKKEE